jgi:hypothetical protein
VARIVAAREIKIRAQAKEMTTEGGSGNLYYLSQAPGRSCRGSPGRIPWPSPGCRPLATSGWAPEVARQYCWWEDGRLPWDLLKRVCSPIPSRRAGGLLGPMGAFAQKFWNNLHQDADLLSTAPLKNSQLTKPLVRKQTTDQTKVPFTLPAVP